MAEASIIYARSEYKTVLVSTFFWGAHAVLYLIAIYTLLTSKAGWRAHVGQTLYVTLLFASATAYMSFTVTWIYQEIVLNANFPGGIVEFYVENFNSTAPLLGNVFFVITNFLADGLLLWRTWVVWNKRWTIVVFPALVFAGSTAMSILTVYQIAKPNTPLFSQSALQWSLPCFSLSIALNLILTLMIVSRLLWAQRRIRHAVGPDHASGYFGIAAMVVESAALYSFSSIIFIATYSQNVNDVFSVFLPLQVHMMCISPLLIIIRVAQGRAFTEDVVTGATASMSFARNTTEREDSSRVTKQSGPSEMRSWPSEHSTATAGSESKLDFVV
ncbi:hypothetical protein EXIGLDRAFT_719627 [Exidia glandulosa HHB12029]|uniref:Uncharacterized protein n=1 Tax=Exidia glandulosa HHB12029 TaxID=1314781 RepID=A0A165GY94_EXIGL|nr:hypothetical protein EXIGLDRAFT_719627 [Exidia glandulosa HHB12029]